MYRLETPQANEYPILLEVWESSVRATHHFLKPTDIDFFKHLIQQHEVFGKVNLLCVKNEQNEIIGFLGVAAHHLEMLFIRDTAIGRGLGRMLIDHAISKMGITHVDVNEQNEDALKFYTHIGFVPIGRSELDGTGKPYPLIHMKLERSK